MADWNPEKDPYYASLYDKKPFDFIDTYRDSERYLQQKESNDISNRINQLKLEDVQKSLDTQKSLSEVLKSGGDYREAARKIYTERGDVEGLQKLDKEIVEEAQKNIAMEGSELNNILKLPPEIAMEQWNAGRLGKKYGSVTDPRDLFKASTKYQGSINGGFTHVDPVTGELVIDRMPRDKPGSGGDGNVNLMNVIDPNTGEVKRVNPRDPSVYSNGNLPYSESMLQKVQDDLANQRTSQEAAAERDKPSALWSYFQNLGKTGSPPQAPQDMNSAYKIKEQGTKDIVVKMRKRQTQGIAQ